MGIKYPPLNKRGIRLFWRLEGAIQRGFLNSLWYEEFRYVTNKCATLKPTDIARVVSFDSAFQVIGNAGVEFRVATLDNVDVLGHKNE